MRYIFIQFVVVLTASAVLSPFSWAQDGDFSLGDEPINNGGGNAPIDDFGETSNLFGNLPQNNPTFDSKSTIVPAPSANKASEASAGSLITKPATSAPPQASQPADSSSPAAGPITTSPLSEPANPPLSISGSGIEALGAEKSAPLVGDGSLAPVRLEQKIMPNDFGGVPPMPGTRREMAPGEAPEFYGVEEGDTMFDVCSQLIDDGNYWPKLWSLNPDVKNPHFIYPGMKLAFYSGDQENPPYLEVVTEDEVVPVEKGPLKEAELVSQVVLETGRAGGSEPTVNVLVNDAPVPIVGPGEIGGDSDGLDGFIFAGKKFNSKTWDFIVPAFHFEDEKTPLGQVVGGANGENMLGDDTRVVIEPLEGLGMGTYTILRPQGAVFNKLTGSKVGYRYDFAGNVRMTKQNRSGLMEGVIFGVRNGIMAGDIVVNFIATKRSIPEQIIGPINTANSGVIGFNEVGKTAGGLGDFVFLEKEGLSVGSSYAIYRRENSRDIRHILNKDLSGDGFGVAVVKVIETSGPTALGYIVSGNSEVRVGDTLSP